MPKYTNIKKQIVGLEAVAESVKASEDVAASRLHLLRNVTRHLRGYVDELRLMLEAFAVHHELVGNRFFHAEDPSSIRSTKKLLVAVGFDRGLTGGLDNRLVEATVAAVPEYGQLAVVGQRLARQLKDEGVAIDEVLEAPSDQVTDDECLKISQFAIDAFVSGRAVHIDVLIPEFESLAVQQPGRLPFLPLRPEGLTDIGEISPQAPPEGRPDPGQAPPLDGDGWPLFLPSPRAVADGLIQSYLRMFFKSRLAESKLSELAARTVACEHAATQAKDEVDAMTNRYFKERRRELSRRQIESFFAHQVARQQPGDAYSAGSA